MESCIQVWATMVRDLRPIFPWLCLSFANKSGHFQQQLVRPTDRRSADNRLERLNVEEVEWWIHAIEVLMPHASDRFSQLTPATEELAKRGEVSDADPLPIEQDPRWQKKGWNLLEHIPTTDLATDPEFIQVTPRIPGTPTRGRAHDRATTESPSDGRGPLIEAGRFTTETPDQSPIRSERR
jgi:hypothetical protein